MLDGSDTHLNIFISTVTQTKKGQGALMPLQCPTSAEIIDLDKSQSCKRFAIGTQWSPPPNLATELGIKELHSAQC
eukprot:5552167-Amphidinium_carterae.1